METRAFVGPGQTSSDIGKVIIVREAQTFPDNVNGVYATFSKRLNYCFN